MHSKKHKENPDKGNTPPDSFVEGLESYTSGISFKDLGIRTPRALSTRKRAPLSEEQISVEKEDNIIALAMGTLYGFSLKEGRQLVNLIYYEPDHYVEDAFYNVLVGPFGPSEKGLKALEDEIKYYEKWLLYARRSDLVKRVRDKVFDPEVVTAALEKAGSKKERVPNPLSDSKLGDNLDDCLDFEMLGEYFFPTRDKDYAKMDEFFVTIDTGADESLKLWKKLSNTLKSLLKKGGPEIARFFAQDIFIELENTLAPIVRETSSNPKKLAVSHILHIGLVETLLNKLEGLPELYVSVVEKKGVGLLSLFKEFTASRAEMLKELIDALVVFNASNIKLHITERLLIEVPETNRLDLLMALKRDPEVISIYQRLRKVGFSGASFAEYVLTLRDQNVPDPMDPSKTITVGSLLPSMMEQENQLHRTAFLLGTGSSLFSDPRFPTIYIIAKNYHACEVIFTDYMRYKANGEELRANLILRVGMTSPSPEVLKGIRQSLSQAREVDLKLLNSCASDQELSHKLLRLPVPTSSSTVDVKNLKSVPLDWYSNMVSAVREGTPEDVAKTLSEILIGLKPQLGPDALTRLKYVWTKAQDLFQDFLEDLSQFLDTSHFNLILKDSFLFKNYLTNLRDDPKVVQEWLEEFSKRPNINTYHALRAWLLPSREADEFQKIIYESQVSDLTPNQFGEGGFKRIIMCDWHIGNEDRKRIEKILGGIKIEFSQLYGRKNSLSSMALGEEDLIVLGRANISRREYYSIKRSCLRQGAGFYHTNNEGYDALMELVSQISH